MSGAPQAASSGAPALSGTRRSKPIRQSPVGGRRQAPALSRSGAVDVAIVGGGIAGGALSIALRDVGLTVALIEQRNALCDRIRGDGLAPWGVAEAARLGLLELFLTAGARERCFWDTWDAGQRRRRDELVALDPHGRGVLTFRNHLVQGALLDHAAAVGVRIVRGARLEGARRRRTSWIVHVGTEQLRAGLLVRADGRGSGRGPAGRCVDETTHAVTGALMRCPGLADDAVATARVAGGRLLLFPLSGGLVRVYYMSKTRVARSHGPERMRALVLEELSAAIPDAACGARFVGALGSFSNASSWPRKLCAEALVHVGDAAGATDPSIGQGVALALRDARELRDLLAAEEQQQALWRYADRRARYFAVQRMVAWASWVADQPTPLGVLARAPLRENRCAERAAVLAQVRADPLLVSPDRRTAMALIGLADRNPCLMTQLRWPDFQAPLRAGFCAHPERQENA